MKYLTENHTALRLMRGRLDRTHAEMGTLLDIPAARVRQYEMGERPIPEALMRLAREFMRIKHSYRTPGTP